MTYALFLMNGVAKKHIVKPFALGIMVWGSVVFFLALLIISSRYVQSCCCCGGGGGGGGGVVDWLLVVVAVVGDHNDGSIRHLHRSPHASSIPLLATFKTFTHIRIAGSTAEASGGSTT